MITDWPIIRNWDEDNKKLKEWAQSKGHQEQLFLGPPLTVSIWETVKSLGRLFPHRRRVLYGKNQDPAIETALTILVKDGYELVPISWPDVSSSTWLSEMTRETLAVVCSADDPFFALKHDISLSLLTRAETDKIFVIDVQHHCHREKHWKILPSPFFIEILSLSRNWTCVRLGDRARISTMITSLLPEPSRGTTTLSLFEGWDGLQNPDPGDKEKVLRFEQQKWCDSQPLIENNRLRCFDRAVIYWENLDGHALLYFLAQQLGSSLNEPGVESRFETTSLSRWKGLKTMDWLKSYGFTSNQLRGSIIINHHQLTPEFEKALVKAHTQVMGLQFGKT